MAVVTAPAGLRRLGRAPLRFLAPPRLVAGFTVMGPKECQGPLATYMDTCLEDTFYGERCWERTESKMLAEAISNAIGRAGLSEADVDMVFSTDLLNQCVSSNFAVRNRDLPHVGLYSACAGFAEALALAAMAVDGGFARRVVAAASSHHDAAERQYRFPTELGVQRPPTAQWTVTGAGAVLLDAEGPAEAPVVTAATFGRVKDMGLKDPYDMGSAMVPAAADTLQRHLQDTGRRVEDYDWILTGDLGHVGSRIFVEWLSHHGLSVDGRHSDCGAMIYGPGQDTHSGGSGLGASACVVSGYVWKAMQKGTLNRVLLLGTGSLHSPTTYLQGESIPVVCHAVCLERPGVSAS